jgi:Ni/Co efflux regulator RcnB/surface antigen
MMKRTMTMIVALTLMSGTAAVAQPGGSQGASGQPPPPCGQAGQPACEPGQAQGNPQGQSEDDKKKDKAKGKKPGGDQGQPPSGQAGPPAGGPPGQLPGGTQGQPPSGQAGPPPGGQQGQPPRGPFGPQPGGQAGPPQGGQYGPPPGGARWSRGERVPEQYRRDQYYVQDWQRNNFPPPPRGYRWMCYERSNCFLVQYNNGYIIRTLRRDDRENYWRRRYSRQYSYNDDLYYRECRGRSDPAGILVGGLIGGLLGRSIGDDRAGATFAGIIIGGALGAALTRDLDCDDRSFAYRSYYDAFNGGRPGRIYAWRNPYNNHRGAFVVRGYYYDDDGFRCARYRHTVWLDRRRRADGYACRQPDGAWLFLN